MFGFPLPYRWYTNTPQVGHQHPVSETLVLVPYCSSYWDTSTPWGDTTLTPGSAPPLQHKDVPTALRILWFSSLCGTLLSLLPVGSPCRAAAVGIAGF